MKLRHLVLALGLALPAVGWSAWVCDGDLAKTEAAIAAGPKANVLAEDFERAKLLRTKAVTELKEGRDVECVVDIGEAMELLDISEGGG